MSQGEALDNWENPRIYQLGKSKIFQLTTSPRQGLNGGPHRTPHLGLLPWFSRHAVQDFCPGYTYFKR
jgi:hypothetical protein